MNDLKNKVRRIDPLPEYDETTPSRTVMALDVPLDRPTIESVAELFSSCGEITLVRILRPGNPVPADVRPFVSKHPEMTTKVCALIEFECTEFAMAAVESLNNNEEGKMKVKRRCLQYNGNSLYIQKIQMEDTITDDKYQREMYFY